MWSSSDKGPWRMVVARLVMSSVIISVDTRATLRRSGISRGHSAGGGGRGSWRRGPGWAGPGGAPLLAVLGAGAGALGRVVEVWGGAALAAEAAGLCIKVQQSAWLECIDA